MLLAFTLAGCISDDSDLMPVIEEWENVDVEEISLDYSDLAEPAETIDPSDDDYTENNQFTHKVDVVFNGTTATVSGDLDDIDVLISGAHVTIDSYTSEVEYIVSGTSTDGGLKIYSTNKYLLTLNGVTLTNPTGAAINNQSSKHLYLQLAPGTVNSLTDGNNYSTTNTEDEKGAFFSEGQIVVSGSGTLNVNGHHRHAIASDDYIIFRPGSKIYATTTAGHGIKANDGIDIRGSVINVEVSGTASKGINSEAFVNVSGGRTTIITTGQSLIEEGDTSTCAAVKCDSTFTMTAGTLRMKSTGMGGKCINATKTITISGGQLSAVALGEKALGAPKALKCDEDIIISGGHIFSYSANSKAVDADRELIVSPGWQTYKRTSRWMILQY
jgi:hypothetical protein